MRRKLAAGNWKMNGTRAALSELDKIAAGSNGADIDILICPPSTLLHDAASRCQSGPVQIGAQDCHIATSGAHTGDISAEMIADAGAQSVILGHSERREDHAETSALVHDKAVTALGAGLQVIICVGESEAERRAETTLDVIGEQLAHSVPDGSDGVNTVVAYEPVWAIGSGMTPSLEQIREVHAFMRQQLTQRFGEETGQAIRLLYGGSVKPGNAADIFAVDNVDGALVGGASLKSDDFLPIIKALSATA